VGWIERQTDKLLPQIASAAFKAKKPQGEGVTWTRAQSPMGDTILVRVSKVDVIEDEQRRSQISELEQAMMGIYLTAEIDARLATIKSQAKIDIKPAFSKL
jgi:peptidyl-prolyl cis-trans isomerase D